MKYSFTHEEYGGIQLLLNETIIKENYFQNPNRPQHSIVWNIGKKQKVMIDYVYYDFPENSVLILNCNQVCSFNRPKDIILWDFDKYFYCVLGLDSEIGCMMGFIFNNNDSMMFISIDNHTTKELKALLPHFIKEFKDKQIIKREMLRILLVQLIIIITRVAKKQYQIQNSSKNKHYLIIRKFHALVEIHFRNNHQIKFYADLLNISSKTLSNYFSKHSKKTPAQIIRRRLIVEAEWLLYYTKKSVNEIASELGFEEVSHFYKFF